MDVSKTNNVELDNEKIMEGFRKSKKEAEETIKDEQKTKEKLKAGEEKLNKIGDKNNVIGKLFDDIKLLFEMVGAWISGKYKGIPYGSIVTIFAALLYFISPIDVIPDFIPVIGYIDDAFVIALTIKGVQHDIDKYKEWKAMQNN